jgi:hypothetical protein
MFTFVSVAFFVGYKLGKMQRKTELPGMSEDEKKKIEKLNKHFQALMNYDVDKATKRVMT